MRRVRSAILILAVALATIGATAQPANAFTWLPKLCVGFTACNNIGMGNAGYQNEYLQSHWGMYGGHNCTNYAAYRLIQHGVPNPNFPAGQGSAYNWANIAGQRGYVTDKNPRVGDIAWFSSTSGVGADGHVAYVESVDLAAGKVRVSEDNWGGDFDWRDYYITDVSGFIHFGGSVGEGAFVSHGAHVYRIAGGAPVYVSSWDVFGGAQPTTALTDAQFNALRPYPADGTWVVGLGRGEIYRFVGGAPIYVSAAWWDTFGTKPAVVGVDQYALDHAGGAAPLDRVRAMPVDGTWIVSHARGEIYRVVGGAPIYVSATWWDTFGTKPAVTMVSQEAVDQAGQGGAWSHLRAMPVDGTWIVSHARGEIYRVVGGAPIYVSATWWDTFGTKPAVTMVSQEAVDQAGQGGAWSHLRAMPVAGTWIVSHARGEIYRVVGGAPIYVSATWWDTFGTKPAVTMVSQEAVDQAGQGGAWSHLRYRPVDGTILNTATASYTVRSGAPYLNAGFVTGTPVDPMAIAHAGGAGAWSHLAGVPVAASAPAKRDGCGSGKDTYTIPAVTGVEYLTAGTVKAAGSYPGTGTVTITARAKTGYVLTGTTTWTLSWTTTACTTTVTGNALSTPTWTVPKATVSWAASGVPAGVASTFDVEFRSVSVSSAGARVYSSPSVWFSGTSAKSGTLSGSAGMTYQVHARVRDAFGTVGAWSSWRSVTMPVDERSASFSYGGTWSAGVLSSYYTGTYKLTSSANAYVQASAHTDLITVVGARSLTSGRAAVYIDGVLKATVDTYAATASYRQTLAAIPVAFGRHTVKIVNLATGGRPRLILDALAFRR